MFPFGKSVNEKNYFFGVVKFGLDNRDSMLTRENFKDTWARPKPGDDSHKSAWQEKMAVDTPPSTSKQPEPTKGMDRVLRPEAERMAEDGVVQGEMMKVPCRMPVFKFQRQGIGQRWKWHHPVGKVHG